MSGHLKRDNKTKQTSFSFFLNDLPYYDHIAKEVKGSQISKAKKLLKLGNVKRVEGGWEILPISGYNKRTYTVVVIGDKYTCNCQYNATKGLTCSHILAVLMYEGIIEYE